MTGREVRALRALSTGPSTARDLWRVLEPDEPYDKAASRVVDSVMGTLAARGYVRQRRNFNASVFELTPAGEIAAGEQKNGEVK